MPKITYIPAPTPPTEPPVTPPGLGLLKVHSHSSAPNDGGVLSIDEHAGYSEYSGEPFTTVYKGPRNIPTPRVPASPSAGRARLFAVTDQNHTMLNMVDKDGSVFSLNRDIILIVANNSGSTITKGTAINLNGSVGTVPAIRVADASSVIRHVHGILFEDIANGAYGLAMLAGLLPNIDTSAFNEGDALWLSSTTAGALTNIQPDRYRQLIGIVTNAHPTDGRVIIRISALPNHRSLVGLAADVPSAASTAFQNITGMSFNVVSGTSYRWFAMIVYTASLTTIGIRVACTAPAQTLLSYYTQVGTVTTGSEKNSWVNSQFTPDAGTSPSVSVATTQGNLLMMWGFSRPIANGTLQLRFAPQTAVAGGIVIKAGSTLEFW